MARVPWKGLRTLLVILVQAIPAALCVKILMVTPHPEGCHQAVGESCCVAPHLLAACVCSEVSLGLFSPEGKFILFGGRGVGSVTFCLLNLRLSQSYHEYMGCCVPRIP